MFKDWLISWNHVRSRYTITTTTSIWWWRPADFFLQFLNRHSQFSKGIFITPRFLLMMSLRLSSGLPVLRDPFRSWEHRICFGSLLSSSQFKLPARLKLHWASISYIPGSLDFSMMNLFGIYCHYLTFKTLRKWYIIQRYIWGNPLSFCAIQENWVNNGAVNYTFSFMERSLLSQTRQLSSPELDPDWPSSLQQVFS